MNEKKIYPVGTKGIAARNLKSAVSVILKGTPVVIIEIDTPTSGFPSEGYTLASLDGEEAVAFTGFDSIIVKETD